MTPFNTLLKRSVLNDDNGPRIGKVTTTNITTAGAVTLTAAQILGGYITRDCNGANRTDTLPTAALLVAALRNYARGLGVQLPSSLTFEFLIQNTTSAAYTITVDSGSGGTNATNHTRTIAQNASKWFAIDVTNTAIGSEAYTLRNIGGFTT